MKSNMKLWLTGFLLAAVVGSQAATITWTNTAGGSFQNANNWNPKTAAPGGLDTAEFKQSSATPYTVTLDDHASVTNVTWPSGVYNMTLDLNGKTLTSAPAGTVAVGSPAGSSIDLTIMSSLPGGMFNLYLFSVFNGVVDARGSLTITGANTSVTATNGVANDNSICRVASNSTLTVSAGAHLVIGGTPLMGLGGTAGGYNRNPLVTSSPRATMLVTDPGTTYSNTLAKGFQIGKTGTNMPVLIVSNGAIFSVKNQQTTIGSGGDTWYSYSPKANGKLVVTGTNSYFESSSITMSTLAGEYGTPGSTAGGRILVEKGGTINLTPAGITLSSGLSHYYANAPSPNYGSETNLNAYGEVIVRDPGTTLKVVGAVQITSVAQGALSVLNGATLSGSAATVLFTSLGSVSAMTTGTPAIVVHPAFTNDNAYGICVISNANSVVAVNGVQTHSVAGYGDIVVADNGRLSATNSAGGYIYLKNRGRLTVSDAFVQTYTLDASYSNSTIRIVLGAKSHVDPYIKTTTLGMNAQGHSRFELGVRPNAALAPGDTITLIQYTGNRTGSTFKDQPEGSVITAGGGQRFRIYYGDGSNDAITLRYLPMGTLIIAL